MKAGVIGSVNSTETTIKCLLKNNFEIAGILGYEPDNRETVSGFKDLSVIADATNIPYKGYKKINDMENIKWMAQFKPDIIFAVGLSQLLNNKWLNLTLLGCVGFHPTYLPKGRGRAPVAWIILEERIGAATFFLMGPGADDGPIFSQVPFSVDEEEDGNTLRKKIELSMTEALDKWLPDLKKGIWNPVPQDEAFASWYGIRTPLDGIIDWSNSSENIDLLIKASTHPYPGAYTFYNDQKIIILKSRVEKNISIKGVIGKVLLIREDQYLIQCGNGLLWIYDMIGTKYLKVGDKLGYNVEYEIYNLKNKLL
jgi:methionyl-tRNA formyltransferase